MGVNYTPEQKNYNEYKTFEPFRMFVLQNFPFIAEDFDSLTYYQMLCKVVEYLKDTVENNKMIQENQNEVLDAFNQLQSYVNNYFDNLDVQEEINNKLNDMVEKGILQEIITAYLNTKAIFGFDNVESMINSENLIAGSYAKTSGYYNINDGGRATYKIRTRTFDDIVDNGSIIVMRNENLVAELIIDSDLVPNQFGAKGNGTDDDTTAVKNCIKIAKKYNKKIRLISMYAISDSLLIDFAYFTMYGTNRSCGFIQLNNSKDILVLDRPYNSDFIGYNVRNLRLAYKHRGDENTCGIRFCQSSEQKDGWGQHNSIYEDIFIQFPGTGIIVEDNEPIWNIDFNNIHIYGPTKQGVYYGSGFGCKFDTTIIGASKDETIARSYAFLCGGGASLKLDIEDWKTTVFKADKSFNPVHITKMHLERCSIINDYGKLIEIGNTPCIIDIIKAYNITVESPNHASLVSIYGLNTTGASILNIGVVSVNNVTKTNSASKLSAIAPTGQGIAMSNLLGQHGCDYAYYPYAPEVTKTNCFYKNQSAY